MMIEEWRMKNADGREAVAAVKDSPQRLALSEAEGLLPSSSSRTFGIQDKLRRGSAEGPALNLPLDGDDSGLFQVKVS